MHIKTPFYALFLVLLTGLIAACTYGEPAATPTPEPAYWPDDEWRTSTPEAQGLDSAAIVSMLQEIQSTDLHLHSVLIIRHGYLVTEAYFPPYARDLKHPGYSITKSVTSAMTGIAVNEGLIAGVQQPVLDYFPDVAKATQDAYLRELTIEHLLTMSAGFNAATLSTDIRNEAASFDAARAVLAKHIQQKPGETFFYDSGLSHVMSTVIQKTSGLTLKEFARRRLFGPLGITDFAWESDPQAITLGGTGLSLRPQDMARLGYLYLHNGEWNGEQIVPAEWVQDSTRVHIETRGLMDAAEDDGYGYYWWIDSWGGYSAHGFGGQYIFVLPKQDMLVVFTGGLSDADYPAPHELVKTYLLPAAESATALTPDPAAEERLRAEIQKIQDSVGPTASLPETAKQISGKTYRFMGNPGGRWPSEITFDFPGGETYSNSILFPGGERLAITGSLNGTFYVNHVGPGGQTLMPWRGYWKDEHTFIEEQNFGLEADADLYTVTYTFDKNTVSIAVDSSMGSFPTIRGSGQVVE